MTRDHQSDYGASRAITAAQKLAEVACERAAAHRGEGLGPRFWDTAAWRRAFLAQVRAAHALLKIYDHEAVFTALRANPGVRSLVPGWVADLVRAEQDRIDAAITRADDTAPLVTGDTSAAPRQGVRRGTSVRSRLKDL